MLLESLLTPLNLINFILHNKQYLFWLHSDKSNFKQQFLKQKLLSHPLPYMHYSLPLRARAVQKVLRSYLKLTNVKFLQFTLKIKIIWIWQHFASLLYRILWHRYCTLVCHLLQNVIHCRGLFCTEYYHEGFSSTQSPSRPYRVLGRKDKTHSHPSEINTNVSSTYTTLTKWMEECIT